MKFAAVNACCACGVTALYRVRDKGYCKEHRGKAVMASTYYNNRRCVNWESIRDHSNMKIDKAVAKHVVVNCHER